MITKNANEYREDRLMESINIKELKRDKKIRINEIMIFGIRNPFFSAELEYADNEDKFALIVDGERVKIQKSALSEKCIKIEAILPKEANEVALIVKKTTGIYIIQQLETSRKIRMKTRFGQFLLFRIALKAEVFLRLMARVVRVLWKNYHFIVPPREWKRLITVFWNRLRNANASYYNPFLQEDYLKWISETEKNKSSERFKYNPKISLLVPVYNISREMLSQCIDSVLSQTYKNFEVCLVDDCSTKQETIDTLNEYMEQDKRVKVVFRKENGHISRATNDALEMATGEFVGLLDNDDVLSPNALYENVKVLNEYPELDFIYSDEDKLDEFGERCDPHFKPDYSPDTLLSNNYICHFAVIRRSIVNKVGGFAVGLEGAQDYDLFLKVTECTDKIYHISKMLYHWRKVEGSTSMTIDSKSYAVDKGQLALEKALERRGVKGVVHKHDKCPYYYIEYQYEKEPSVSIIIPTKDYADTTRVCLESVFERTNYTNYEVVVVNNNSEKQETFDLFEEYKQKYSNFKVIDANIEFNYSKINNIAVRKTSSDVIVLLNNDTEIITPDWLKIMAGYAMQEHIGAVGAKLLYPDSTVQHGGVLLGMGGVAGHVFIGVERENLGNYARLAVPFNYGGVTAACLAVERRKFNEVGGLEEDLTVAFNDVDFNMKLLKAGYYNVMTPHVELFHFESKSRGLDTEGEKQKRFIKECEYMYKKWENYIQRDPFYNQNLSKTIPFFIDVV